MKTNFDSTINDLAGKPLPLKDGEVERTFTMRDVCVNALLLETQESVRMEGKEKIRRFRLADRIYGAKEPIQLSAEDVVLLKEVTAKTYGPLITGRAWDLLEPPTAE